ncbi:MAG: histone deacetylase family protein [Candidatus Hodarchaeales archaeon]|jgi:acetoin utilization deacetylase AcuC-like enzyme
MRIIFHENFNQVYTYDPAAEKGRMQAIVQELSDFEFIKPIQATDEDILLVHEEDHLQNVKTNKKVYDLALLAAGGAIKASELAMKGEPSFAVIRPPGHHAGPNNFWGFCYFNNIAIAIQKLLFNRKIQKAVILDFDLHYGDGTDAIFNNSDDLIYYHVNGTSKTEFIDNIRSFLSNLNNIDIIGVSAGFDRHEMDWGKLLSTENYNTIGQILNEFAEQLCNGRRFAVLEGGYNHKVLGKNVHSFVKGF